MFLLYISNMGGIYCIENKVNKRFYIGSTENFNVRFYKHKYHLNRKDHLNALLQNAWNKWGEQSFEFNILEVINNKESLLKREQHYLDIIAEAQLYIQKGDGKFVTECYNLSPTAGRTSGWKANDQQIERNRETTIELWKNPSFILKQKQTRQSDEWKNKTSKRSKKLWENDDFRQNIIDKANERFSDPEYKKWWIGIMNDPDRVKKCSKWMKKRWQDEEYKKFMKDVSENNKDIRVRKMKEKWDDPKWREKQIKIRNSPQTKQKKRKARLQWIEEIGDNNPMYKKVGAFDPKTNTLIVEYISLKHAKEKFGKKCIRHYILNYPKVFHGLVWKYID